MKLRGVEFGRVTGASGVQGFFGEGYWFHRLPWPAGPDFRGATFVAKTTTLLARPGNMPLRADHTPAEWFPPCIRVDHRRGIALNAVGLSGPGAEALFAAGRWQRLEHPFMLSFMSVGATIADRLAELSEFVRMALTFLPDFRAPVALQLNFSCPNVSVRADDMVAEAIESLERAAYLGVPLLPKFNLLTPHTAVFDVTKHPLCDGFVLSNTIPWGKIETQIPWRDLFGSATSPLANLGGGGLSGAPLFPLLVRWIKAARQIGIRKPINAGGGILSLADARVVLDAGADSVFLGSIAFLRPWRVSGIVRALA